MKVYYKDSFTSNTQLICLLSLSEIINKHDKKEDSLHLILNDLVHILPGAMHHSELAGMRVVLPPVSFSSPSYKTSKTRLREDILIHKENIGFIEVSYNSKSDGTSVEFTNEDRILLLALSYNISRLAERLRNRQQLETERAALKNANATLHEVLNRVQIEKDEIANNIQLNINKIILPILFNLSKSMQPSSRKYIDLINMGLMEILSPYISKLSNEFMALTPQEILVCNMIRNGMSSKDIAELRGISVATVNTHRDSIRKKLGIKNEKVNLKSYLINHLGDSSRYT